MFPIMLRRPRSIVQAIPICMAAQGQRPLPLPVAANKALAKAGITVAGPTSPVPPGGLAPLSMKYASTGGISGGAPDNRGSWTGPSGHDRR